MMHSQPAITDTRLEARRSQHKTNRRRSTRKANNTNALQTSLETGLHTLSLALLPVTLLILLWMVIMGATGNSWFASQPALQPNQTMASSFTPKAQTVKPQQHLELLRPNVTVPIARTA
jgi:lipopolysaccharide/colanic/teichoic acid biosynthesis glycosyltransferase